MLKTELQGYEPPNKARSLLTNISDPTLTYNYIYTGL